MQYGNITPNAPVVMLIGPEDLSEGASSSPWISMANYGLVEVHILIGDIAGATSAVTLDQATDNSGTGSKTLGFTRYYQKAQKILFTGRSAANFVIDETITGGSSSNTANVQYVSSTYLLVCTLTQTTTWTDTETITGGTSGATATVSGTGQDEDIALEKTAGSDTFNTLALTWQRYVIPIDDAMLDADNAFDHFQLDMADASASETQAAAFGVLLNPRYMAKVMPSVLGTQKMA